MLNTLLVMISRAPILSDDLFLIRCKMQMSCTRKAMEYITNFLISMYKKYKVVPRCVDVVVTNAFPEGGFNIDKQMNVIYQPLRFISYCCITMFL